MPPRPPRSRPSSPPFPPRLRRFKWRTLLVLLCLLLALPLAAALLFRVVDPPLTPLMLMRKIEGDGMTRHWVSLERISPHLMRAVMAGEDTKFCRHNGFDWDAIGNAFERYESGGKVLGASTISMQTAKNVFLWPGRDFLRKGLEAGLTVVIEAIWGKPRIMEVYLNVAEWGVGIFGAEAAARAYFNKPAAALSSAEAARMAAVLPSPRRLSPVAPSRTVLQRGRVIEARMRLLPAPGPGQPCP